jgi:ribosome-associated translation inhibitor RaiA
MNTPTSIGFRNMDRSPALAGRIEHEVEKLRRYAPMLNHCEVTVAALHRHHRRGHHYQVHLTLRLPGTEVVVTHESPARRAVVASGTPEQPAKQSEVEADHRDAYVVVRDAFEVARRRLEDTLRRKRDRQRTKGAPPLPRNEEPAIPESGNIALS